MRHLCSFFKSGAEVVPEETLSLKKIHSIIQRSATLRRVRDDLTTLRTNKDPSYQRQKRLLSPMIQPTGVIDTRAAGEPQTYSLTV